MEHRRPPGLIPAKGEEIPVSVLRFEVRERTLWISIEKIPQERFPPCIRMILESGADQCAGPTEPAEETEPGSCGEEISGDGASWLKTGQPKSGNLGGSHRAAAILAAFLGQAGWDEHDAMALWSVFASRNSVSPAIFRKWFARMHCPSCRKIKSSSPGYPNLGLGGLGYCHPDGRCSEIAWPVGYGSDHPSGEEDRDAVWGMKVLLDREELVHLHDWRTGKEAAVELTDQERSELEAILETKGDAQLFLTSEKVKGRRRIRFIVAAAQPAGNSEPRRSMMLDLL